MGTWVCPQHYHHLAGARSGTAGRPSPALPRDAWRWIEIPSQELAVSCSPLDPEPASRCPVHFLARRIFASPVCPAGPHQSPRHGIPGGFWLAVEAPKLEEPRAPSQWSKSVVTAPNRAWPQSHSRDADGLGRGPCAPAWSSLQALWGDSLWRWPRQMSGEEEKRGPSS